MGSDTGAREHFRAYTDGIFFGVERTSDAIDEETVFARFTDARRAVVRALEARAADYKTSVRQARQLRLTDVEDASDV